jgi:hypothetical protein
VGLLPAQRSGTGTGRGRHPERLIGRALDAGGPGTLRKTARNGLSSAEVNSDGLAVHAAIRPDVTTPERMRTIIARHLDELQHTAR